MYVSRDKDGKIIAAFRWPSGRANERLNADDADLLEFLNPQKTEQEIAFEELSRTDKDMARVAEDVIDVLVSKGLIDQSDLPLPVVEKLEERKSLRTKTT